MQLLLVCMQTKHPKVNTHSSPKTRAENTIKMNDYAEILASYGLEYRSTEYYWQVGQMRDYQGWVLHLSVVIPHISELLRLILPVLLWENFTFKVVRNRSLASQLLEGQLGFIHIGKIISIYPPDNYHGLQLAKKLMPLTKSFKGPSIPTARWLGEVIYTQFETIAPSEYYKQNKQKEKVIFNSGTILWPFNELISSAIPKPTRLLNSRYYPITTIKQDAKGDVVKALYFKKPWDIRTCIIKQGRKYILFDDYNRDIRDRLKWQYQLCEQLSDSIPLPRAIDFFEENGDVYFVMEFIHGSTITAIIDNLFMNTAWPDLPHENQIKLTAYLSEVIDIVHRLHEKGFVHRDITPENFLVDRDQCIWMLDIELIYSMYLQKPSPPFQLGTPGFMSPEQLRSETPTIKDDIYSIGAFMLTLFVNLPPIKLLPASKDELKKSLFFFIRNEIIGNLICDCFVQETPSQPDLIMIWNSIVSYRARLQRESHLSSRQEIQSQLVNNIDLRITIQAAINGIGHSDMLSPKKHWLSNFQTADHNLRNEQIGMIVYPGWHTGLAGPLWLLAIANENAFEIEKCSTVYRQSWDYIIKYYFSKEETEKSLYTGGAGISLALSLAFRSHLLSNNNDQVQIEKCFSEDSTELSLEKGIAGIGLALLQARHWMNKVTGDQLLNCFISTLLNTQRADGTWHIESTKNESRKPLLLMEKGAIGIIWFLLHFLDNHSNNDVLKSVTKALNWLIKSARKTSALTYSASQGIPGITLALIKAFQVTGDNQYRTLAELYLKSLPERLVLTNFSLGDGLAGIGEIYLEAYKTFKDPAWLHRADWIAQVFLHTFRRRSSEDGYWVTDRISNITADLFSGNSGIIHFLMHYLMPEKLQHPLIPYTMINPGSV